MVTTASDPRASEDEQPLLRLSNRDPTVTPSASAPDRFTVKFTFEGVHLRELVEVLEPRLAAVGVESVHRFGLNLSLYGVEPGRERDVYAEVEAALAEVNASRAVARGTAERDREASDAATADSAGRLQAVRDGFHAARSV